MKPLLTAIIVTLLSTSALQSAGGGQEDANVTRAQPACIAITVASNQAPSSPKPAAGWARGKAKALWQDLLPKVQTGVDIAADLCLLAAGSCFAAAESTSSSTLGTVNGGFFIAGIALDFFRSWATKANILKQPKANFETICLLSDQTAQLTSIAGLGVLLSQSSPLVGTWMVVAGFYLKDLVLVANLATKGIKKTYGNKHSAYNMIVKFCLGTLGSGVGAGLLGASASASNLTYLYTPGAYLLSGTVIGAGAVSLVEDCLHACKGDEHDQDLEEGL